MFEHVPYFCCNKDYTTLYDLYAHKKTHLEKEEKNSPPAKAAAPEDASIPTDLLMKKVFTCTYCSKSYASHSGLKNHLTKLHNKQMQ